MKCALVEVKIWFFHFLIRSFLAIGALKMLGMAGKTQKRYERLRKEREMLALHAPRCHSRCAYYEEIMQNDVKSLRPHGRRRSANAKRVPDEARNELRKLIVILCNS